MTDEEALKEIDRQEKRFAAAKCGRGLQLAKSAREYYQTIVKCRQKSAEVAAGCAAAEKAEAEAIAKRAEAKKLRSRVVQHRRIVKDGESLKCQAQLARARLEEKLRKLAFLSVEQSNEEDA